MAENRSGDERRDNGGRRLRNDRRDQNTTNGAAVEEDNRSKPGRREIEKRRVGVERRDSALFMTPVN